MAYIPDRQLLFLHIPKNAGKSIEVALGLDSPEALHDLGRRSLVNRIITGWQRKTANIQARQYLHGSLDITLCAQHLTLQEIRLLNLLPHVDWHQLESFAICRNPWDRALSTFRHYAGRKDPTPENFETFCRGWYDRSPANHNVLAHQRRQIDFVLDERGSLGVKRILRFENLATEFAELCSDWKLGDRPLLHIGQQRKGSGDYATMYTAEARDIIAERFAEDIEFFNYGF